MDEESRRHKGRQTVSHLTVNGTIRLGRVIWWRPGRGADDALDRWLGIADSRVSVGARELCCRATLGGLGFEKAAAVLWRLGQVRVSKERLRQIVEAEGREAKEALACGRVLPAWSATECHASPDLPSRLLMGCDGVMVPVVTAVEKQRRRTLRRRRRKGRRPRLLGRRCRGSETGYKEFKLAAFYDEAKERQHAVGTAGNHDALGRLMRREAGRLAIGQADETAAVVDGAEWIRRQLETRLPMVQVRILDYYHLMQHVGQAADTCFGEGNEAGAAWRRRLSEVVKTEGAAGLLVAIHETLRAVRSLTKRQALKALEQYVAKRAEMLDYPTFLTRVLDIGSGPTEAFCKTLTLRLKGSGMRWNTPNAEALMTLAALDQSNLWTAYWKRQNARAA